MVQVWITKQNEGAIFEASVTGIVADCAPEAVNKGFNAIENYGKKFSKTLSFGHYELVRASNDETAWKLDFS